MSIEETLSLVSRREESKQGHLFTRSRELVALVIHAVHVLQLWSRHISLGILDLDLNFLIKRHLGKLKICLA